MASAHIPEQSLLSYPSQAKSSDLGHSSSTKLLDEKRIYVGNLDSTIDEYAVVKLFSPFGKITKLDFMFHWHGPKKGTPRGYCFIEYENSEQAATAVKQMNRKPIKLKPLSVSLANMAPLHTDSDPQGRKRTLDPKNRPTAFSLLKTSTLQNASTEEKIKAMERKLAQMTQPPPASTTSSPPIHSSLPPKPMTLTSSHRKNTNAGKSWSSSTSTSAPRGASSASGNRYPGSSKDSGVRSRPY